jgi:CRP-like cAMP-binding protein
MNIKNLFINLTDPVIFQSFGGEEYWTRVKVAAGGAVFKEGDDSQDFYYVFSGMVKITKCIKDAGKTERDMALLSDGDFFGEGALLSDKMRLGTATALSDTVLLKMSQANFEKLVKADPGAAVGIVLGIVKVLNARLQDTNERLVAIHNVSKLVRSYQGNMDALMPVVLGELAKTLHHGLAALFELDGSAKVVAGEGAVGASPEGGLAALKAGVMQNLAVLQSTKVGHYRDDSGLFVSVLDLSGQMKYVLAVPFCKDCEERDTGMVLTFTEQISHLA